jgi:dihydroorotate dehydrogenase electron transfer subunit
MPLRWDTPPPEEGLPVPDARLLGKVIHHERVGAMFLLRLRVPGWRGATPGQFAMLQPESSARFLPRAFSLHAEEGEDVAFLIAPVGAGTEELAELDVGRRVLVLGPLGRGFEGALPGLGAPGHEGTVAAMRPAGHRNGGLDSPRRLLVSAGGVGAAPFVLLLEVLARRRPAAVSEVVVLLGFRDDLQAEALHLFGEPAQELRAAGIPVRVEAIAEDGSLGRAGLVTTLLKEELQAGDVVFACGAHAMCEALWDLCLAAEAPAWFSLEAGMACGFGSCQGCVIEVADGSLVRVCREGPVFAGSRAFGRARHPCTWPRGPGRAGERP